MFRIRVERRINKPIAEVFEALCDHAHYDDFPGVDEAELLEPGETEVNGLGALRAVRLGAMKLQERIVAFERPIRLGYQITQSSPLPFEHDLGEITLKEEGNGTHVIWISEGRIRIPILGKVLFDKLIQKQGSAGFDATLRYIERR